MATGRWFCLLDVNGKRLETTAEGHAFTGASGTNVAADAVVLATVKNLTRADDLLVRITAAATLDNVAHNATLDLILQRTVDDGTTWDDFINLGQVTNLTAYDFVAYINGYDAPTPMYTADKGDVTNNRNDSSVSPFTTVLLAGERRWGHWGPQLRLVAKRSANTTAGTVVTLDITGMGR